jgi:hypothetical protein
MKLRYIFPVALALCASPSLGSERKPSAEALPLSAIVSNLEKQFDIEFIDGIDWDEDGYWEIELYTKDGAKVELRIDPVTGQPR